MKEELGDVQKYYIDGHLLEDPKKLASILKAPIKAVREYIESKKQSMRSSPVENKNYSVVMTASKASEPEMTKAEGISKYEKSIFRPDPNKKSI